MEPTRLSNFLVNADKICDYIPGISTVTNIVNLVQKIFLETLVPDSMIWKSHYYTHLDEKGYIRCLLAILLPVLGNYLIFAGDDELEMVKKKCGEENLGSIALQKRTDRQGLINLSAQLENDKSRMLKALQEHTYGHRAIECASRRLKDDEDVALAFIMNNDLTALHNLSPRLQCDSDFKALGRAIFSHKLAKCGSTAKKGNDWTHGPDYYQSQITPLVEKIQFYANKIKQRQIQEEPAAPEPSAPVLSYFPPRQDELITRI